MTTMVRKQVYLEPDQNEQLKKWAEETGKSEAEIIREALDRWLEQERKLRDAEEFWEMEKSFIESRIAEGPVDGGRTWTREELYEDRIHLDNRTVRDGE
jgi:predicted DNA-binding protein